MIQKILICEGIIQVFLTSLTRVVTVGRLVFLYVLLIDTEVFSYTLQANNM